MRVVLLCLYDIYFDVDWLFYKVNFFYGKNSAYTQATDLYNSSKQGTKIGSIVKGTSTELEITGNYAYIGLRSKSSAMYITSITIEWK